MIKVSYKGSTLNFPDGTSEDDISEAMSQFDNEQGNQQQSEPAPAQPSAMETFRSSANQKTNEAANYMPGTPLNSLRQAASGVEIGGEALKALVKTGVNKLYSPAEKQEASRLYEPIKQGVGSAFKWGAQKLADQIWTPGEQQEAKRLAGVGVQKAQEVAKQHPVATQAGKDIMTVAGVVPVGKGAEVLGEQAIKYGVPAVKGGGKLGINAVASGFEGVGKAITKTGEFAEKNLTKAASELSKVSEEALKMASTTPGKNMLKEYSGKANEVGKKLLNMLDNPHDYLPEAKIVNDALEAMPNINLQNTIKALEQSKIRNAVEDAPVAVNDKIDRLIYRLKTVSKSGSVSAKDFRDIRNQLDIKINWDNPEEAKLYDNVLVRARTAMKNGLLDAAEQTGIPEYSEAMKILSSKLDAITRARDVFARGTTKGEFNAESVMRNLFNKGKQERLQAIKAVEDVFGSDFVQQAKLAQLADQIGEGGVPAWLPQHTTGKALLGKGALLPLSSPKIFTGATLPALEALKETGSGFSEVGETLKKFIGKGTKNIPQSNVPSKTVLNGDRVNQLAAEKKLSMTSGVPEEWVQNKNLDIEKLPDEKTHFEDYVLGKDDILGDLKKSNEFKKVKENTGNGLRLQYFGRIKGDIKTVDENTLSKLESLAERVNNLHNNDYNEWVKTYGAKGYPDTDNLHTDDLIDWMNQSVGIKDRNSQLDQLAKMQKGFKK